MELNQLRKSFSNVQTWHARQQRRSRTARTRGDATTATTTAAAATTAATTTTTTTGNKLSFLGFTFELAQQ